MKIIAALDGSPEASLGARVGGLGGMILGSVSRAVSKAAPCSTLVVTHGKGASEPGGS